MFKPTRLFTTGGTIDKVYLPSGDLGFEASHVPDMLTIAKITGQITITELMRKDSLDMTDADRLVIAEACRSAQEDSIVITHGTDTMAETASAITNAELTKTIVLTGAMRPYSFGNSDSLFNVGTSVAYAQTLPNGVYVSMNGHYFEAGAVQKNYSDFTFEQR